LAQWSDLEPADLVYRFDLSPAAARRLGAAVELGRRALAAAPALIEPLRGGAEVYALLQPRLAGLNCECFHALYLDAKGRLAHERMVSLGTLTSSLVHPREVFAPAVAHRAAAVIVAHNHPSGDPEPSAEDRATTRRLQRAGRLLGIELLDHVVVARTGYVSFLERGWLGS
jgi:DNA repair protein RadC